MCAPGIPLYRCSAVQLLCVCGPRPDGWLLLLVWERDVFDPEMKEKCSEGRRAFVLRVDGGLEPLRQFTEASCWRGSLGQERCPQTLQFLFQSLLRALFSHPRGSFVLQKHFTTTSASVQGQGTAKWTCTLDVKLFSPILSLAFGLCLIIHHCHL